MSGYGTQVTAPGWLDFAARPKNWLLTRCQYRIMDLFAARPDGSPLAQAFSASARRLVGGYLYSLKIEVNNYCTNRCRMCYVPQAERRDLPLDALLMLFDQIAGYRIRVELLGGEPLMREDIVDVVAQAKQRARSPLVTMYSNGMFATPALAGRLKQAGLDAALITLVSHDAATHDAFTGRAGSWQATTQGIRNLRAAGVEVYTFTSIHAANHLHYREVHRFAHEQLGAHAVYYQYIPQKTDDPLVIDRQRWHEIKHWVLCEQNRPQEEFVRTFYMLTGSACSGGNFVLTVRADGTVQPCPFIFDIPLGNILQQDIWTIHRNRFENPRLVELKRAPEECAGCSYLSICGGGCRAGHRALYGGYGRKDHRCRGPYQQPIAKADVIDCVPTFF